MLFSLLYLVFFFFFITAYLSMHGFVLSNTRADNLQKKFNYYAYLVSGFLFSSPPMCLYFYDSIRLNASFLTAQKFKQDKERERDLHLSNIISNSTHTKKL